ncbi:unnamed protein product [Spirodela intermedia]|uniref:Uncharacterized protein n=1 Tax=Spirodela intermedia TaxID=51605 RepID=A0A7I8JB90_SPIIN|nr:unnamed protein product [Spirodela intermedia]CAA6666742.1 unnamed protein product [Spirodela intermedia]
MEALLANPSLSRPPLLTSPPPPPPLPCPFSQIRRILLRRRRRCSSPTTSPSSMFPFPAPDGAVAEDDGASEDDEAFGEVNKIIGSRSVPAADDEEGNIVTTEFLIEWKDGHAPSWVLPLASPLTSLPKGRRRRPLRPALRSATARDPDALDSDGRAALHFVAGLGSEACIRLLAGAGADVDRRERSGGGLTPLHMAAGYARPAAVKALLELGADPEAGDDRGRTAMDLAREVLAATPKANPATFTRRLALEAVIRELEAAVYEFAEVEQVLEARGDGERKEFLVQWKDGGDREWIRAKRRPGSRCRTSTRAHSGIREEAAGGRRRRAGGSGDKQAAGAPLG